MHIEKHYRELEDVEELHIYNINKINLVEQGAPQVKKPEKVRFSNIMKHVVKGQ